MIFHLKQLKFFPGKKIPGSLPLGQTIQHAKEWQKWKWTLQISCLSMLNVKVPFSLFRKKVNKLSSGNKTVLNLQRCIRTNCKTSIVLSIELRPTEMLLVMHNLKFGQKANTAYQHKHLSCRAKCCVVMTLHFFAAKGPGHLHSFSRQ